MIKVSIIIPIYKVEQYIEKCLNSVLEQSYDGVKIECILVDDCSPDKSMEIVHAIVGNYQGNISFVFLKHLENKGLSAARNTGLNAASGEYVMFVDSDDWLPNDSLRLLIKCLKNYPDADFVAGIFFNRRENRPQQVSVVQPTVFDGYSLRKGFLNYQDVSCTAWNKLLRKDIIRFHFFPEGIIYEDNVWAYKLFKDIKKAIVIPEVTYIYENDHPQSITNTAASPEKIKQHMKSVTLLGNTINDNIYADLYVESVVFLLGFLITALRLRKSLVKEEREADELLEMRKRVAIKMLNHGHLLLFIFFCFLTYSPSSYIFNIGWVCRHFHLVGKFCIATSNMFKKSES